MYDHCTELAHANTRVFYTGDLPSNLQDAYNRLDWNIRRGGANSTWGQLKEQNKDTMEYYCEELNKLIDDYEYTGTYNG